MEFIRDEIRAIDKAVTAGCYGPITPELRGAAHALRWALEPETTKAPSDHFMDACVEAAATRKASAPGPQSCAAPMSEAASEESSPTRAGRQRAWVIPAGPHWIPRVEHELKELLRESPTLSCLSDTDYHEAITRAAGAICLYFEFRPSSS
jgi:hypothetical protein